MAVRAPAWHRHSLQLTVRAGGEPPSPAFDSTSYKGPIIVLPAQRAKELAQAVRSLEAMRDVMLAIASAAPLEETLDLIVRRLGALVHARALPIMLRENADLVGYACVGDFEELRHARLPLAASTCGGVLRSRCPQRVLETGARLGIAPRAVGIAEVHAAMLVPIHVHDEALGLLLAFDRPEAGHFFDEADQQILHTFAAHAAAAIALTREDRPGRVPDPDEQCQRWAQQLHAQALEAVSGLSRLLSDAPSHDDLRQEPSAPRGQSAACKAIVFPPAPRTPSGYRSP